MFLYSFFVLHLFIRTFKQEDGRWIFIVISEFQCKREDETSSDIVKIGMKPRKFVIHS
jgi:hypothetical protein